MSDKLSELYPQAYREWVASDGIESNFRAHLAAIGVIPATPDNLSFMTARVEEAKRQLSLLWERVPQTPKGYRRAADISYLTGEIDDAFCDKLRSLGVDLVIVGLQVLALAHQQLSLLKDNGFKLQGYFWPSNKELVPYLGDVISIMRNFKLGYLWIDVEESELNVRQSIAQLTQHPEFQLGIYTSAYMWQRWMNSTTDFCHLPLWYARYDYSPDMEDFTPFAGWTKPVMKQYDARNPRYDLDVYDPLAF